MPMTAIDQLRAENPDAAKLFDELDVEAQVVEMMVYAQRNRLAFMDLGTDLKKSEG